MEGLRFFKNFKVFYGYWIVAVTFLCLLVFSGGGFYVFSLFARPLEIDFGWSRGQIMTGHTVLFAAMAGVSPFIGRLVDRYGARRVMSIGASVAGLGFLLLSQMHNLWQFYAGYAIVGIGTAAMGVIPATTVVSNWFKKRRGTALGIMSIGIGAGGVVFPLLFGTHIFPNFSWNTAYLVLALFMWILIPPVLLVIKTKPADIGLYPDGIQSAEPSAEPQALPPASVSLSPKMALSTPVFWLIAVSYLANGISTGGIMQSQVSHLMDIGFPLATGATVLIVVGVGSIIGKFGFGWLCDRIRANYAWAISCGLMAAAIFMFMSVKSTTPLAMMWLYAIILGLGYGGWLPTMSMLTSTNFGLASYGTIFGMVALTQSIGISVGPLIAGRMYDTMNTYHWAFILFIALYGVAIPTALAIRRPKSQPNFKGG